MCKKKQFKYCPSEIDECMKVSIRELGLMLGKKYKVVACCCGHKKYPMSIVIEWVGMNYKTELFSGRTIRRKRNFYKKDAEGYYFIPETVEVKR